MKIINRIILILLVVATTACAKIGPDIIQASGNDYNIAIQRTIDEQLLLNLIRLKYHDTPFFLEVNSVSSQFKLNSEASLSATLKEQQTPETVGLSGKLNFTEQPTVTYLPLHGNDFIQRLLKPISIDTIILLANSGWSIERILRLTVDDINGIPNAPNAGGPTPATVPDFKEFQSIANIFRDLQIENSIDFFYDSEKNTSIIFYDDNQSVKELRKKLNLGSHKKLKFINGKGALNNKSDSIVLSTRSFLGVMYYLSHSVDVPDQDKNSGVVTITYDESGNEFDWSELTNDLFEVKSGGNNNNIAISTNYRNTWFYIDDSDLNSKTTFSLLMQLFSLQSGKSEGIAPLLTLPIGQ
tara:strand:- start:363 stop:1427 length:1065 start_codon:yes stop_codon:yes gene_type:complete